MSAQHLEVLETTVQKTHHWIDTIADASHLDSHTAYQVLRAVLHTIRDRLPPPEVAQLAAQLPLLLRGIFYEGWRPGEAPTLLNRDQFLALVKDRIITSRIIDPSKITKITLRVMDQLLGRHTVAKIASVFPKDIRSLFPDFDESPNNIGT